MGIKSMEQVMDKPKRTVLAALLFIATIYLFWAINLPERFVFQHLDASDFESLVLVVLVALWGWLIIRFSHTRFQWGRARHWLILNVIFLTPAVALGAFFYIRYDIPLLASAFVSLDIPLALIFFNSWSIYAFKPGTPTGPEASSKPAGEGIQLVAKMGKRKYVLNPADVLGFQKDEIVYCYTRSGERFVLELSLAALEEQLDSGTFFRLHRQHLVHRDAIRSFRSQPNKSVEVELTHLRSPGFTTAVSRHRAADFRKWVRQGSH